MNASMLLMTMKMKNRCIDTVNLFSFMSSYKKTTSIYKQIKDKSETLQQMSDINDLPPLCLNLIASHLGESCDDVLESAECGATLALVGNAFWSNMSNIVYDFVDPGSEAAKNVALALNIQKRKEWAIELDEFKHRSDCSEFKLDKLKAECKRYGIKNQSYPHPKYH